MQFTPVQNIAFLNAPSWTSAEVVSYWDYEPILAKAKLYAARAAEQPRESALFPFWSILALELIGRAVLARVHPVLLADPQDGQNILFAFGLGAASSPRSIPAKTVFLRCVDVVPDFTKRDFESAMSLMDLRNTEVHTGLAVFEGLSTHTWQAEYYRLLQVLGSHIGLTLTDILGADDGAAAEQMIAAARDDLIADVAQRLRDARAERDALPPESFEDRNADAQRRIEAAYFTGKAIPCPICGATAVLRGEYVGSSAPEAHEDGIWTARTILPTRFNCMVCRLVLSSHDEIYAAARADEGFRAFAGQFDVEELVDPVEFYDIEPEPYFDPGEYMND